VPDPSDDDPHRGGTVTPRPRNRKAHTIVDASDSSYLVTCRHCPSFRSGPHADRAAAARAANTHEVDVHDNMSNTAYVWLRRNGC
jgi:hypothetical protein